MLVRLGQMSTMLDGVDGGASCKNEPATYQLPIRRTYGDGVAQEIYL